MYKESKWAKEIIDQQQDNGSWGQFHGLSEPTTKPLTTEQALRRLEILGYTYEVEVVQRAVEYMEKCLLGSETIPDYREKHEHWDIYVSLMLATWIRRFTKDCEIANKVMFQWKDII